MRGLAVPMVFLAACGSAPCRLSSFDWGFGQDFVTVVRDGTWTSFDAGESCGTRADGSVECVEPLYDEGGDWPSSPPLAVLAAGGGYDCGITLEGSVFCVDDDGDEVIAPDGTFDRLFVEASPCAIAADRVECWLGDGWVGRHGDFVRAVSAVESACALDADGTVECWDQQGESEPTVLPDQPWDDISHSCGMSDGNLVCSDGFADDCDPTPGATTLVGGSGGWCFLDADGRPICRHVEEGEVRGLSVPDLDGLITLSMGDESACGLDAEGTVTCWGAGGVVE